MFSDTLYALARAVVLFFFKVLLKIQVEGSEKLPQSGGLILASNHTSYLDIPCLAVASPRRVYFIARDDLFRQPLLNVIMKIFGTIPILRGKADFSALRATLRQLERKRVICLFPEGTRSPDGTISESAELGLGFLAIRSEVPVIPVYIHGTHKALPKGSRWFRPHSVKIQLGEPIYSRKVALDSPRKERYQKLVQQVMRALRDLQEKSSGSGVRND